MLRPDRQIERVYLHRAPIDMRKQIDSQSSNQSSGVDVFRGGAQSARQDRIGASWRRGGRCAIGQNCARIS